MFDLYVKKEYVSAVLLTKENALDVAMLTGATVTFTKDGRVAEFVNAARRAVPLAGQTYVDPDGRPVSLHGYAAVEEEAN